MSRRVLVGIGAVAVLLLVGGAVLLFRGASRDRYEEAPERYVDRTILLPDDAFVFPDVTRRILTPSIHPLVDPQKPLDEELTRRLMVDTGDALRQELSRRVEQRVEDLLFDE